MKEYWFRSPRDASPSVDRLVGVPKYALLLAGCIAVIATSVLKAQTASSAPQTTRANQTKFFENHVRPLLVDRCTKCHGPRKQENGLRLDSLQAMLAGGESGPAIVPGHPEESLLIEAVRHESLEMPPDDQLPAAEIDRLVVWIKGGAHWPTNDSRSTSSESGLITNEDRAFWSFQPVRDPAIPLVDDQGWSKNGLDRFIIQKLRHEGLAPADEADRRTLIRRLYADLVGLPPTPEQIDSFLSNESPTAYEDLVDALLASPHYGERWGRRWLDLVRYAESNGHGSDQYRPTAWRYRDYVIRAFNEDMPYDRFVEEQLAADEIAPDDPEAWVATGFLRHWIYESNQRKTRLVRQVILTDLTDVTGDVFLGMGLGCARCHDHKFDPILQKDYYRIQSFFSALLPRDDIPVVGRRRVAEYEAGRRKWEAVTADLRSQIADVEKPAIEAALKRDFGMYPQDIKDMYRKPAAQRTPLEQVLVGLVQQQLDAARVGASKRRLTGEAKEKWDALQSQLAEYREMEPEPLPYAMVVADINSVAPLTTLPGQTTAVQPGFLSVLDSGPAEIKPIPGVHGSTGRRAALARWIASADNPLTVRVIVNRIWQYHFGRGLVGTSSDFGQLGDTPTHPELLDWLASRFLTSGWQIKQLHRLILTSATYRQTALRPTPEIALQSDPDNHWLWRMNIRRLDAELIRDTMLAISGDLDLSIGGPSVESSQPRRTVYLKIIRNEPDPLMRAFDAPDGFISTAHRDESTTPTQALMLMNGDWSLERANALAERIECEIISGEPRKQVTRAYRLCFGRTPEQGELRRSVSFLQNLAAEPGQSTAESSWQALTSLCHVLLNANEFLYTD